MAVKDLRGRQVRDLRISVTDRCNMRCTYCMPKEIFGPGYPFLERSELLTYEEIARLAGLFVDMGVRKIRVTGGEPLVRRDLPDLVGMLRSLGTGIDLAITSNGLLLARYARALADAGLDRASVSLDTLDDATLAKMGGTTATVNQVLAGIEAAAEAGLRPVKINTVVVRGRNDAEIVSMAERFRSTGHVIRFIEYMDVGTTNGWRRDDVVTAADIVAKVSARFPLEPIDARYPGEVVERWRYTDGAGEIGVIASVTRPFCGDCTRARLSADGKLYLCLFAATGTDLKSPLRAGASDAELAALIERTWSGRDDRYSELRSAATIGLPRVEMSYIGG